MELAQIKLSGFKSFANQTTLSFSPGITAIVGPNGSGKSNIADAIRWALGEQSKKSLRGKKSEDIIFAGSASRARIGRAEVSVSFKNPPYPRQKSGSQKVSDFSEITITRRFYRNGEGESLLNSAQVRLKDIQELIAEFRLSPKTYTIIGQGMIDKLISLSPVDKKEIFLDASGAKILAVKKEEAVQRLAQTQTNLTRVRELIHEIEPHLKRLRRQYQRAQRREKIAAKLAQIQKAYFQTKLADLEQQAVCIQNDLQKNQKITQAQEAKICALKSTLATQETQRLTNQKNWQKEQGIYNHLLLAQNKVQEKIAMGKGRLQASQFAPQEDLKAQMQKEVEDLQQETKNLEQEMREAENYIQDLQSQRHNGEQECQELKKQASDLTQKQNLPLLATSVSTLQEILVSYQNLLESLEAGVSLDTLSAPLQAIQGQLKILLDVLQKMQHPEKLALSKKDLAKLEARITDQEALLQRWQAAIQTTTEKIHFLNYQRRTFVNKIEFLHEKILQATAEKSPELTQLAEELGDLEKEKDGLANQITACQTKIQEIIHKQKDSENQVFQSERALRQEEDALRTLAFQNHTLSLEANTLSLRKGELTREIHRALGPAWQEIQAAKDEVVAGGNLLPRIERYQKELAAIGAIDPETLQEYTETQKRYDFLAHEMADLEKTLPHLGQLIKKLEFSIEKRFQNTFAKVNDSFKKYFRILFGGGRASLARDSENNINIFASPPGKRLQNIAVLSGGEKSLVGLSLVFAILNESKPPFCILDEVDAALDEANSLRFAQILKTLSPPIQFITITHNRATMQQAQALYGVTMGRDGVSKMLSLKLEQ